jgi:hypothetical protein
VALRQCPLPCTSYAVLNALQAIRIILSLTFSIGRLFDIPQIIHEKDFFGGPFVPEFLFHRYGPLKLLTWASLCLECTGFFLVWFRPVRVAVVVAMILLHVGIDATMNMHIFEWISIIGWLMFLIESEDKATSPPVYHASDIGGGHRRRWVISAFVSAVLATFCIDTFPLIELYDLLVPLFHIDDFTPTTSLTEEADVSSSISVSKRAVNALFYIDQWRSRYFIHPFANPILYPLGLHQGVWNLYSGAPDTFCRYEILLSTYDANNMSGDASDRTNPNTSSRMIFESPDWGTFNWYEKKRWQRPMTMYEKLPDFMCRECFVQYYARQYLQRQANADVRIASLQLQVYCERPPPPPAFDDWFNWTGWFYANAKQDKLVPMDSLPSSLYMLNFCDDRLAGCSLWQRDGLCEAANHVDRFSMTQLCRRSCSLCPEHGYNADHLINGTRISVVWPVPSNLEMFSGKDDVDPENTPFYFDATIISVKDLPGKRYLLKYDDSFYNDEWFDPIVLRERGYRLLEPTPSLSPLRNREDDSLGSSQAYLSGPAGDEL